MTPDPTSDAVLTLLQRADKHFLGGGDGVVFAPPLPLWLERPGFWDGVHYFLHRLQPAFTVSLVDAVGRALPLRTATREWSPAALACTYPHPCLDIAEARVLLPGGRLVSEWTLHNSGTAAVDLTLVAWTAQEGTHLTDRAACQATAPGIAFRAAAPDAQLRGRTLDLDVRLHFLNRPAEGWDIAESQHMRAYPNAPTWQTTPFVERWAGSQLSRGRRLGAEAPALGRTLVFLGISTHLLLAPGADETVTVAMDLTAADPALRLPPPAHVPAGRAATASRQAWQEYFGTAPVLATSDPYLERYFPYRWYGLRLNFLDPTGRHDLAADNPPSAAHYRHPTCAEGIEFFHDAVSYSAWCHMRELRWLPDPARARGALLTFLDHQRSDGGLPGIIYADGVHPTAFYFADWGGSLLALHEVHPDASFLATVYDPLCRFADHTDRTRDPEESGLYAVLDPYETGQETMRRYTVVDPAADRQHFAYRLQLKGVDSTVYTYRLRRALAVVAAILGRRSDVARHDAVADRIGDAVRQHMWDGEEQLFFDVDPRTGLRTGAKAAVCFYPYFTDIAGAEHLPGIGNLFDPTTFWLPYPVPSTAADDPTFDADGDWKDVRQSCPWNGRVWPMTNSHIAEALALQALTQAPELRQPAADFLTTYLRMLFFDSDPARPNAFEHYSPFTGHPASYRGIDDYQHSWINDLIIRFVVGFRPTDYGFVVDPFPCRIEHLRLRRLPFRGTSVTVEVDGPRIVATVAGTHHESRAAPLEVRL